MTTRVVFDIETLAFPLESFDEPSQKYLTRFADTDEKMEELRNNLNLHAVTAQVIAIACHNPDSGKGKIFYQSATAEKWDSADGAAQYISGSEKEILELFWNTIRQFGQIITFNGRSFDAPFLMIRSGILGVKATRNLLPYRYKSDEHCDLLEQLTFYSAARKFSLDFYCKAFGIESPKSKGISGLDMKQLWEAKRFKDIAEYCYGDVKATGELFERWNDFMNV